MSSGLELTGLAAIAAQQLPDGAVEDLLVNALTDAMSHEAQRNGTPVPDLLTATNLIGRHRPPRLRRPQ
ncbi:hypothetical protein [Streptomyces sp. NPDC090798]|uniref:hypothetical protein n=1 Tax=Streptomyces sp. NPDC090798 TaxID=3365968 RepID=UPI00383000BC